MSGLASGLTALVLVGGAAEADTPGARSFEERVRPFLRENCYSCHGHRRNRTDLNLEAFDSAAAVADHPEAWENVVAKLRSGAMPPEERPRPDPDAQQAALEWIGLELERVARLTPPDPGRVTARRLNGTEYDNTIRDLLGLDLAPSAAFPQDDAGYGFDNIGDVLSLSPLLLERYMRSAERLARTAVLGRDDVGPTLVELSTTRGRVEERTEPLFDYDETGLTQPNSLHALHRFPADGEYAFRMTLGGQRPVGGEPLRLGVWIDGALVGETAVEIEAGPYAVLEEDVYGFGGEVRARVSAGERWVATSVLEMYAGLPARYGGPDPSPRPFAEPSFTPPDDATPREFELFRQRFERRRQRTPALNAARIVDVDLAGPFGASPAPARASLEKVFSCGHLDGAHGAGCGRRIVADLARRAYRRPVAPREVDGLLALVQLAEGEGESFEAGIALALQAILVSPDFLFRIEREPAGPTGGIHPVSQHELASRLSYFLWASMPDAELLDLADGGRLREPEVVAAQVRRMLADPRSRALASSFGAQWLQFRGLESVSPDRDRFPGFEENLRLSMARETELFFDSVVREDRSILDFIDARDSFVNERLARHYGLEGVRGPEFRRVSLEGSARGGIVTHASVLTVTSYATRTSPVLRGKWILDNLLNAPPKEPPPDVPNLDEEGVGRSASLREQLEAHRADAICSSCHSQMDPLGFGLENFDAVGAWRSGDGRFAIDASGTLPDGRSFTGAGGLRSILREERAAFAEGLTEKLLTYALGRGLERYDRGTVGEIAGRLPDHDYRFSGLVLEIVNSLPFQMRRAAGEGER